MAVMTSSLGRGGPSPSELVSDSIIRTVQPGGACSRIRRSPSGVSAQFFDRAARSTTSSRSPGLSASMDTQHISSRQQTIGNRLELDGGTDESELEGSVVGVIECLARDDVKAMHGERLTYIGEWSRGPGSHCELHHTTHASHAMLDAREPVEDDHHEDPRSGGLHVEPRPD